MFRRFFAAIAAMSANAEALAASFAEANDRFRVNLALDHTEAPAALEHTEAEEEERPARKNGRK